MRPSDIKRGLIRLIGLPKNNAVAYFTHELVTFFYRTILKRVPDKAGLNKWVRKLKLGTPLEVVYNEFTQSVKYLATRKQTAN